MNCQRCNSERVLITRCHGRDCQSYELEDGLVECGYAPRIEGICDDDDLFPEICLDCGQTQGTFPKPRVAALEALHEVRVENFGLVYSGRNAEAARSSFKEWKEKVRDSWSPHYGGYLSYMIDGELEEDA